jgi:hypothetical protein
MLGAASGFVASSASAATLVGEWNFDNSDLDNTGSTGATHDGTASGTLTYATSTLFGGTGQALDASVASSYMSIDNSSTGAGYVDTFDGTSFSVSLWMKADPSTGAWKSIADKGNPGAATPYGWDIRKSGSSTNARADINNTSTEVTWFSDVFDNEWHHIVMTVDSANNLVSSYLDAGTADTGAVTLNTVTANDALNFGQYIGLIDEIKFYDGVLTSEQVTSLNTTNAIPEPGSYALLAGLAGMAFVMARRRI